MKLSIKRPKLTSYQENFLYNGARFTIVEASTKIGKTHAMIWWLFEMAHMPDVKEGQNYWWVAPVYSQAKIAFKRMRRKVARYNAYRVNESELIIYCPNGAEIHFKTASDSNNLFGEDVYACVFDEAPRANEEAWVALRSTFTKTKAPCKLIGNFGGISNWVHKMKEKAKTDPEYAYFKVTCYDAVREGILDIDEVEQAKRDLSEKEFLSLYMAEASNDSGQLIQNESLTKMYTNTVPSGTKYITADIARLGKDKTVIFVWDGLKVMDHVILDTSKVTESAASIQKLRKKHNVNLQNVLVDEDGVGGGVKDILGCRGFVNNSRAVKVSGQQQNFASLKDQCYYKLAEMINANLLSVDLPHDIKLMLTQELEQVRLPAEVDTQRIKLVNKENIKKIIGRSPDYSDALMMRMFFELNPNYGVYHIR